VKIEPLENPGAKSLVRDSIGGSVCFLQGFSESLFLLLRGEELHLCNELHNLNSIIIMMKTQERTLDTPQAIARRDMPKPLRGREAFLPTPEGEGLQPRNR
jgi:hypothetical protein